MRSIEPLLGAAAPERRRRARWLCWGPYLIGSVAFTLAGLLNPLGARFAFTSALATFGGTAFLAWLPAWVKAPAPDTRHAPVALARSPAWIIAGALALTITVGVLGPSVRFAR